MKKAETDQKYEEMDLKFEETEQQIEILKVFTKNAETAIKNMRKRTLQIWGNRPKKEETI